MPVLDIKDTEVLFTKALDESNYNELISKLESLSSEIKYADFTKMHMEPFWSEKHEFEEEPWIEDGSDFEHYLHKLDSSGRIFYVQHKIQFPNGINVEETFAIYDEESMTFYAYENSFCGGLRLLWVRHGKLVNGLLTEVCNIGSEGQTSKETFTYADGKLTNSFYTQEEREYNKGKLPSKAGFCWATRYSYYYDSNKQLNKVVRNGVNLENNEVGEDWVVFGDSEL